MGIFSIKVVNQSGHPVSGARVTVHFGIWAGFHEGYTDNSGWVSFGNNDGDLVSGEIYINSKSFGKHSTYDGDSYSFSL